VQIPPSCSAAITCLEVEEHEQKRARKLALVARKNRDLRIKHHLEVERRKEEQRLYDSALQAFFDGKERLEREYKEAIQRADDEYNKVSAEQLYANR